MTSVLSHGIKNKNKNELLEVLREFLAEFVWHEEELGLYADFFFFFILNLEELKIINFINCDRPKTY